MVPWLFLKSQKTELAGLRLSRYLQSSSASWQEAHRLPMSFDPLQNYCPQRNARLYYKLSRYFQDWSTSSWSRKQTVSSHYKVKPSLQAINTYVAIYLFTKVCSQATLFSPNLDTDTGFFFTVFSLAFSRLYYRKHAV